MGQFQSDSLRGEGQSNQMCFKCDSEVGRVVRGWMSWGRVFQRRGGGQAGRRRRGGGRRWLTRENRRVGRYQEVL